MSGKQVGSAHVAVFPTFTGFGSAVASQAKDAGTQGGKAFSSAFGAVKIDVSPSLKQLEAAVASSAKALSAARLKQQDAAGKARIAEAQLTEAMAKYPPGSSQVVAAEEKLASANRKLEVANQDVANASDKLTTAQKGVKDATEGAANAAEPAANKFVTAWNALKDKLTGAKEGVKDDTDKATAEADNKAAPAAGKFANAWNAGLDSKLDGATKGIENDTNKAAGEAGNKAEPAANKFSAAWNLLKSKLTGANEGVKDDTTKAASSADSKAGPASSKFASAWNAIKSKLVGAKQGVEKDSQDAQSSAKKGGSDAGLSFMQAFKASMLGNMAANLITSVVSKVKSAITSTLSAGMERAISLDNVRAQLNGLYHDTDKVTSIMNSAKAAVDGTAYSLADGAKAAQAMAAANRPLDSLTGTLKVIADTAFQSGRTMDDVGAIFGKIASKGHLTGVELNQLETAGINAVSALSTSLGISQDKVRDMVKNSQISFDMFETAMDKAFGGSAQNSGKTFSGSLDNVHAALNKIVAAAAEPAMGLLTKIFVDAKEPLNALVKPVGDFATQLATKLQPAVEKFGKMLPDLLSGKGVDAGGLLDKFKQVGQIASVFSPLGMALKSLAPMFPQIAQAVGTVLPVLAQVAAQVTSTLMPVLAQVVQTVLPPVLQIITKLAPVLANIAATVLPPIASAVGGVASALAPVVAFVAGLIAKLAGIQPLIMAIVAAIIAYNAVLLIQKAMTLAATIQQWLMNAAMTANPIGIVIALIAALVAGLIWFFTKTEAGQKIIKAVADFFVNTWNWIKDTAISIFTAIGDFFSNLWLSIKEFTIAIWQIAITWLIGIFRWCVETAVSIWTSIKDFFVNLWNSIKDIAVSVWQSIIDFIVGIFNWYVDTAKAIWGGIADFFVNLWRNIHDAVVTAWTAIKDFFIDLWQNQIVGRVSEIFQKIADFLVNLWENIKSGAATAWQAIKDVVMVPVNALHDMLQSVWDKISAGVSKLAEAVKTFFKNGFSSIAGIIKAPINAVIAIVNGAIRGLNRLHVTIPSWVPGIGGQSWGPNIPLIPSLAKGADILPRVGGTLVRVGEAGETESVVNTGGVNKLIQQLNARLDSDDNQSAQLVTLLQQLLILVAAGHTITLDGKALVGATLQQTSQGLANRQAGAAMAQGGFNRLAGV